tara:strand:- start:6873 stop:7835 length:963 start_codon:yes stop_codon:yes gene_type:complete
MAVYTQISNEEFLEFIKEYNFDESATFSGIKSGTSNSNYLINLKKDKYILTIFEERTNQDNLSFFFELMNHLNMNKIKCPQVLQDKNLNYVNSIKGKNAVITTFLDGHSVEHIDPDHCSSLGKGIARMHNASSLMNITRKNELGFTVLPIVIDQVLKLSGKIEPEIIKTIEIEYSFLENNMPKSLPTGIIHADLFPDNIFFEGKELSGIIDFYFSCNDFYAYEIAICINAWCFEPSNNEFNPTKARSLLKNYNNLREFSIEEVESLPVLTRASALRYLLTRLLDYYSHEDDDLILKKDPNEYLMKLKFHQTVRNSSEYGL